MQRASGPRCHLSGPGPQVPGGGRRLCRGGAVNEGELSSEIFFEDLIELELYLQAFKDGVTEGYGCLLVNYTDEGVDVFSVENEDEVENIARENNLTDFQTFYEPEHFIINC